MRPGRRISIRSDSLPISTQAWPRRRRGRPTGTPSRRARGPGRGRSIVTRTSGWAELMLGEGWTVVAPRHRRKWRPAVGVAAGRGDRRRRGRRGRTCRLQASRTIAAAPARARPVAARGRPGPRSTASGRPDVLPLTRSAAAAISSAMHRRGHRQQVAVGVGRARQVVDRRHAGAADGDVDLADAPRPPGGVGDHDGDVEAEPLAQDRLAQSARRRVGIGGQRQRLARSRRCWRRRRPRRGPVREHVWAITVLPRAGDHPHGVAGDEVGAVDRDARGPRPCSRPCS